jgi:hypothetical protein
MGEDALRDVATYQEDDGEGVRHEDRSFAADVAQQEERGEDQPRDGHQRQAAPTTRLWVKKLLDRAPRCVQT